MQPTMEEKHIYLTPLSVVFEHILVTNISEAFTQFQKKLLNLFYGVLGLSVGFLGPLLVLEKLLTPNAGCKHLLSGYEEALSYALIRQSQPSLMRLYPVLKFPTLIREHHNDSLMLLLLIICIIYISSITN